MASARTRNRTAEAIAAACPADAVQTTGDLPFSSARRYSAVALAPLVAATTADGKNGADGEKGADIPAHEIAPGVYAIGAPQSLLPLIGGRKAMRRPPSMIEQTTHDWASKVFASCS